MGRQVDQDAVVAAYVRQIQVRALLDPMAWNTNRQKTAIGRPHFTIYQAIHDLCGDEMPRAVEEAVYKQIYTWMYGPRL